MQHGKARGFTLVELLMVIALITLLAAILFPSLKAARQAGQRVQCTNNLRQLHVAAVSFASDNAGWLPYARRLYENENNCGGWPQYGYDLWSVGDWYSVTGQDDQDPRAPQGSTLAPYFGINPAKPRPDAFKTITGYGPRATYTTCPWGWLGSGGGRNVKNIMTCPGVTGINREYWPSYGLNPNITSTRNIGQANCWPFTCAPSAGQDGYGWPHDYTRQKLNTLRTPAALYLFGDRLSGSEVVNWGSILNEYARTWYGTYEPHTAGNWGGWNFYEVRSSGRARHGDRRVRVYADGHAEVYKDPTYFKVCGNACLDPTGWIDAVEVTHPTGAACN